MGWLSGLVRPVGEQRSMLVTPQDLAEMIADEKAATGRSVSAEKSLLNPTVFACVRLIAESVGMLPLIMYRKLARGKERATDHPLYTVLHDLPNPELTALELFENLAGHLALWGNAFCEIEYDGAGRRRALWPLRPDRMSVEVTDDNERVYVYTLPDGSPQPLPRWKIWHVRGWGTDAWLGKSPVTLAREAIGLALATEEFGARFFGNNSQPGGILVHPGKLTPDSAARLKKSWESAHQGLSNAQRVAVLEEGLTWTTIGVPPEDAQFLETRAFQEIQICQIYRVPPHMIGIVDKSTSWGTGIGQQTQAYVTFGLGPYLKRISQSVLRDLLTREERSQYFAEHLSAALVVNDLITRSNAYNIARNGGWLSINDIRDYESLNPISGGDDYLQPLNMGIVGKMPPVVEPVKADAEAESDGQDEQDDD